MKKYLLIALISALSITTFAQVAVPQWKKVANGIKFSYPGKTPTGFDTLYSIAKLRTIFSTGGGGVATVTNTGTYENASISGTNINIPNLWPRVWNPLGTIMSPDLVADGNNLQEPCLLNEGSPQILTDATSVFKMVFTAGGATQGIYYAESVDGQTWERRSTVCIANHARTSLLKVGSTYYIFCVPTTGGNAFGQIDLYSSTDMVTWTLAAANIISKGSPGTWDGNSLANLVVNYDGTTFHMLLSANNSGSSPFTTGYFHSTSVTSGWVEYGSNPVMGAVDSYEMAASYMKKIGSKYYVWAFGNSINNQLPTDNYTLESSNLTTWTYHNSGNPTYARAQGDEGFGESGGQVANPWLVEVNGQTHLFYSAVSNGAGLAPGLHLKHAIANYTLANLINTNEGNGGALNFDQPSAYSKTASDLNFIHNATNVGNNTVWDDGSILIKDHTGYGVRVADYTTPTTFGYFGSNTLSFYQSGGVANTINSSSTGLTITSGGFNSKFDNTGTLTVPTLDISGLTTKGGVLYASNTTGLIGQTAAGTSGYVLTSNGSGSAPTFQAAGGGITLTTSGSSGAATLVGTTLNIPVYGGGSAGLTPTTTKTANYTAVSGDMVMCNTTSSGFTITMPASPADGAQVGVHLLIQGGTNAITVHDGANNGFNNFLGNQTISYLDEVVIYQFKTSDGTWRTVSNNITESSLNSNYISGTANATYTAQVTLYGGVLTEGTSSSSRISLIDNGLYFVKSGTTSLLNSTGTGLTLDHPFKPAQYTVSTLPAGVGAGYTAVVTDATAPTYLGLLTGGGSAITPVIFDGTSWRSY